MLLSLAGILIEVIPRFCFGLGKFWTISNLSLRLTNNVTFVTREMVSFLWVRNLFVRKKFIALFGDVVSAI